MKENTQKGINLDFHKMMYHPKEVARWLSDGMAFPINIEVGLSGACNHRCSFCAFEYLEYHPDFLDKDNLLSNFGEMEKRGLKSVLFAGFGEPMLHKDAADIIHSTKKIGIDCALSTNGVFFSADKQDICLRDLAWIRFSMASPVADTYSKIHRCRKDDFDQVVKNLSYAAESCKKYDYGTTLGIQMLILPESIREIPKMAKLGNEIGADYVSIKPFNQGHKKNSEYNVEPELISDMYDKAKEYETDSFRVFMRRNLMDQHTLEKPVYDKCGMLDFFCIINADGTVIPCTVFPGEEEFVYGNINDESFVSIWDGEKRKSIKNRINGDMFRKYCYSEDCKMRMQNEYLYRLKNPHPHVNFV